MLKGAISSELERNITNVWCANDSFLFWKENSNEYWKLKCPLTRLICKNWAQERKSGEDITMLITCRLRIFPIHGQRSTWEEKRPGHNFSRRQIFFDFLRYQRDNTKKRVFIFFTIESVAKHQVWQRLYNEYLAETS